MTEFRVFLPVFDRADGEDLKGSSVSELSALYDGYVTSIESALSSLLVLKPDFECRTDDYYIASDQFGSKQRDGKKLEVKYRRKIDCELSLAIEHYSKVKYGKKGILHYREDILEQLKLFGILKVEEEEEIAQALAKEETVSIPKSRVSSYRNGVSIERCLCEIHGVGRWISVALEGEKDQIVEYLSRVGNRSDDSDSLDALWTCLAIGRRMAQLRGYDPMTSPIVGGYPTFTYLISGNESRKREGSRSVDRRISSEVMFSRLENLTNFCGLFAYVAEKIAVGLGSERMHLDLITVRDSNESDISFIVEGNISMAMETESLTLDRETVTLGTAEVIRNRSRGFFLVAEQDGNLLGQLMVTYEWSDWRNGNFWWIQSVHVLPKSRGKGVYRALFRCLEQRAAVDGGVCGLRLYAEKGNTQALNIYRHYGMEETDYRIFEK